MGQIGLGRQITIITSQQRYSRRTQPPAAADAAAYGANTHPHLGPQLINMLAYKMLAWCSDEVDQELMRLGVSEGAGGEVSCLAVGVVMAGADAPEDAWRP